MAKVSALPVVKFTAEVLVFQSVSSSIERSRGSTLVKLAVGNPVARAILM